MGRFDNYIHSQRSAEQDKLDKQGSEKLDKDLLRENRRNEYIPLIKKALTEFNDVLPRINKWSSGREFVRKSIMGIKTFKEKPIQLISLRFYNTTDSDCITFAGTYISKDGRYYFPYSL